MSVMRQIESRLIHDPPDVISCLEINNNDNNNNNVVYSRVH